MFSWTILERKVFQKWMGLQEEYTLSGIEREKEIILPVVHAPLYSYSSALYRTGKGKDCFPTPMWLCCSWASLKVPSILNSWDYPEDVVPTIIYFSHLCHSLGVGHSSALQCTYVRSIQGVHQCWTWLVISLWCSSVFLCVWITAMCTCTMSSHCSVSWQQWSFPVLESMEYVLWNKKQRVIVSEVKSCREDPISLIPFSMRHRLKDLRNEEVSKPT